jgi:hypothetical protein
MASKNVRRRVRKIMFWFLEPSLDPRNVQEQNVKKCWFVLKARSLYEPTLSPLKKVSILGGKRWARITVNPPRPIFVLHARMAFKKGTFCYVIEGFWALLIRISFYDRIKHFERNTTFVQLKTPVKTNNLER